MADASLQFAALNGEATAAFAPILQHEAAVAAIQEAGACGVEFPKIMGDA